MKSNRKSLVRAYDKALKAFDDLERNKRMRRRIARFLAFDFHDPDKLVPFKCQDEADEIANDNVYYMIW